MSNSYKSINFHMDKATNQSKIDKINIFLKQCKNIENQLLKYCWDNFDIIIKSNNKISMERNMTLSFRDFEPRLKSHHFANIRTQVYEQLKSIQSNIINNKLKFKFEDKEKQAVYNYFAKCCFNWGKLTKKIVRLNNKNKITSFEQQLINVFSNKELFDQTKQEIEDRFWEIKSYYKLPQKKSFQIRCNSLHTVKVEKKYFEWIFIIDNNERVGGTEKKGVFDKLIIPVKCSEYHKRVLKNKQLKNTFNLRLNKYDRIEITACYKEEISYPPPNPEIDVGIDIGLNKLICTSDGEIVEQNTALIKRLDKISRNKYNRMKLQKHLRQKYNDKNFVLPNKNYLKRERKVSNFVQNNNRHLIKNFIKDRTNCHMIMEDLNIVNKGMHNKRVNRLLRRMRIQNIKNDIIKYAKQYGVAVSLINPAYTSQICSKCGNLDKNNRKSQERFECTRCGLKINADFNASFNIRDRYYDKRIKLNMKPKEIRNILIS